jgi:hypothetical protein
VAGCCECGDEPSGSCATELVVLGWGPNSRLKMLSSLVYLQRFFSNKGYIASSEMVMSK